MVKEVEELKEETKKAVSRVAAEYKFAVEFKKELEKMEGEEDPKKAVKEVRNGLKILRWVGRAERRVDQSEKKILFGLEELGEILPENLKTTEKKLHSKLEIAEKKLVELASMFAGKLKKELHDIKTDEALLKRYEEDPEQARHIHQHLSGLFAESKGHVADLIEWVGTTETILKSIEGFEATLEKLSA